MQVDLKQRLTFPPEIAEITVNNLRPDLVLWSKSCQWVFIVEITVLWEESIDEVLKKIKLRYSNLATETENRSWEEKLRHVEVSSRGFVASSTTRLLTEMGIRGQAQSKAVKALASVTGYG